VLMAVWYDIFLVTIRVSNETWQVSIGAGVVLASALIVYVAARHPRGKDCRHIPVARCVTPAVHDCRPEPRNDRGIARAVRAYK
jgi:hypothetical protein